MHTNELNNAYLHLNTDNLLSYSHSYKFICHLNAIDQRMSMNKNMNGKPISNFYVLKVLTFQQLLFLTRGKF